MGGAHVILATTPSAMDVHRMESVKDVSRCTSFTFTQRSPKEELKTRTSSWSERPPIVRSNKSLISSQALRLEMNHELPTDNSAFSSRPPGRHAGHPRLAGADPQDTRGIAVETSSRRLGRSLRGRQN